MLLRYPHLAPERVTTAQVFFVDWVTRKLPGTTVAKGSAPGLWVPVLRIGRQSAAFLHCPHCRVQLLQPPLKRSTRPGRLRVMRSILLSLATSQSHTLTEV